MQDTTKVMLWGLGAMGSGIAARQKGRGNCSGLGQSTG